MPPSSSSDLSPLQLKQDDQFYTRLLTKESDSSFRIYYGVAAAGSVPFRWESRPGMPKAAAISGTLPPLTPPPSHDLHPKKEKKPTKRNIFSLRRRSPITASPSSSASSRATLGPGSPRRRSAGWQYSSSVGEEQGEELESLRRGCSLCFGPRRSSGDGGSEFRSRRVGFRRWRFSLKNRLLFIFGRANEAA
ncbi:hypothetical protein HPP92_019281 [Vanilla planifolia]|uniref:Uncharacterized protein n=1 Tax=Vanilla planifolia TaxID=51239 RepID=A0A835QC67_VANPL|nr:hypothetical protein HPP92_019747 [Vanilla planifolia]KAG0465117.1 hypothetical protein HPP92_019281 [Vanilla planifolia]